MCEKRVILVQQQLHPLRYETGWKKVDDVITHVATASQSVAPTCRWSTRGGGNSRDICRDGIDIKMTRSADPGSRRFCPAKRNSITKALPSSELRCSASRERPSLRVG